MVSNLMLALMESSAQHNIIIKRKQKSSLAHALPMIKLLIFQRWGMLF